MINGISSKNLGILFRQISVTLSSGISILTTFEQISKQQDSLRLKKLTEDLLDSVCAGSDVSDVFSRWDHTIPPVVTCIIRAGEKTGQIDGAFAAAADICEFNHLIKKQIISSLLYPAFLLVFSFLILPLPTFFSSGFQAYLATIRTPFLILFVLIFVGYALLIFRSRNRKLSNAISSLCRSLPVFGKVFGKIAVARFAKVLSVALKSGLDIAESLKLAADASQNQFIIKKIYAIIPRILGEGASLANEIEKTGEFSLIFCNFIAVGEKTGNMDEMLEKAANIYHEEVMTALDRTMKLLGPIVFIIIAIYLGYQIVGFWRDYFGAIESINR